MCDVAKLLDFGLVRLNSFSNTGNRLTGVRTIAGTPAFMSPEQAADAADVDSRSDIYSLGAVAYFLLVGRPPFVHANSVETMAAHLSEQVVPPHRLSPEIPCDLDEVIMRCMEKGRWTKVSRSRSGRGCLGSLCLQQHLVLGAGCRLVAESNPRSFRNATRTGIQEPEPARSGLDNLHFDGRQFAKYWQNRHSGGRLGSYGRIGTRSRETVPLMRCLSRHFRGHRSIEGDSHKTIEFSARKSCAEKRMRIREVPNGGSHQRVLFSESKKRVGFMRQRQACRCRLSLEFIDLRPSAGGQKTGRLVAMDGRKDENGEPL